MTGQSNVGIRALAKESRHLYLAKRSSFLLKSSVVKIALLFSALALARTFKLSVLQSSHG